MTSGSTVAATTCHQIVTLPDIPELYNTNFLDFLLPAPRGQTRPTIETKTVPGNSIINALKTTSHALENRVLTANLAPAYRSTLSPTLDAFQSLKSAHTRHEFDKYLKNAWAEDPEMTLRIIWNIRSIHDGKGDKELFYNAFGWLYKYHPWTAIHNLPKLVEPVCTRLKSKDGMAHGYWKDLLNILTLATVDELYLVEAPSKFLHSERDPYQYNKGLHTKDRSGDPATRRARSLAKDVENKKLAQEKRQVKATERYANLTEKLNHPKYRALYITVARLFADRISRDLQILDELKNLSPGVDRIPVLKQISLAGKWAPTPMGSHDRHTNIATAIALLLREAQTPSIYPSALNTPLEPEETAIILRSFFQRWVLTPLRSVSLVAEPLMTANRWGQIKYSRVPSVCMKNNTLHFFKHDMARFREYLASVEKGKTKISGATLFPHDLVAKAFALGPPATEQDDNLLFKKPLQQEELQQLLNGEQIRVVEAQWQSLIKRLRESGSLDNSIAICDVSGSMGILSSRRTTSKHEKYIRPILPAISLSLVLASLSKPPFNNGFITFSSSPKFVTLDPKQGLYLTVEAMSQAEWGMSTDLNAVFLKLLLPIALENRVPKEEMIKRVFVFTDMQFNNCSEGRECANAKSWKTNHDMIEKAYRRAGYEMPQIVYWDLAARGTVEVMGDREGVAMMNGFSPAMMKVFMEANEEEWEEVGKDGEVKTVEVKKEFNPISVMKKALMKPSFDGLVVLD